MWLAKAWAIAAVATLVICVLLARYTVWGRQFWRITGDYFTGRESVKVWVWLAVILLSGGRRCPAPGAAQLPEQRHVDQLPGGRRAGHRHVGNDAVKHSGRDGFWLSIGGFLHPGRHFHRTAHAGHVPGPAVLPGVARLADRPAHRRLARRQGLLPGPLHRRQDRQPRPAHPVRHRHLHRRQRAAAQRPVLLLARTPCCSARSTRSRR